MCTGEWIDATLEQVIDSYPELLDCELIILEGPDANSDFYYLGEVNLVFDKYKKCKVFYTDIDEGTVQLEGELDELNLEE